MLPLEDLSPEQIKKAMKSVEGRNGYCEWISGRMVKLRRREESEDGTECKSNGPLQQRLYHCLKIHQTDRLLAGNAKGRRLCLFVVRKPPCDSRYDIGEVRRQERSGREDETLLLVSERRRGTRQPVSSYKKALLSL